MVMTVDEAQVMLSDLIDKVAVGESVVITRHNLAVAILVPAESMAAVPEFGCCRGMLSIEAEDAEHLADFAEYMP